MQWESAGGGCLPGSDQPSQYTKRKERESGKCFSFPRWNIHAFSLFGGADQSKRKTHLSGELFFCGVWQIKSPFRSFLRSHFDSSSASLAATQNTEKSPPPLHSNSDANRWKGIIFFRFRSVRLIASRADCPATSKRE